MRPQCFSGPAIFGRKHSNLPIFVAPIQSQARRASPLPMERSDCAPRRHGFMLKKEKLGFRRLAALKAAAFFRAMLPMRKVTTIFLPILLLLLALAEASPLAAQANPAGSSAPPNVSAADAIRGKKLILKDGTVQIVREYQVIGDRVRFYSVERADWEEIPASLVDWEATRKAAGQVDERAKQAIALAHRVDLEEHPGRLDVDAGLGLPPGVVLPPGDGMYAFNGHSILHLKQDLAKSNLDKGRYIAKLISPLPVVPTRFTIFLEGKRAKTRIADSEPVFYFRTDRGVAPKFQLIRAKTKGKDRVIGFLREYMGQKETQATEIPLNIRPIYSDTYRIMAVQDIPPGEYVLAEPLPASQTIDLYVWDFGIDSPPAKASAKK
ncbi:MAG TPA: hypothetical protein VNJ52_06265 [Patescibacteria group bacterium]|nr:hypothetical protein [Patescibacteria group bacterium]